MPTPTHQDLVESIRVLIRDTLSLTDAQVLRENIKAPRPKVPHVTVWIPGFGVKVGEAREELAYTATDVVITKVQQYEARVILTAYGQPAYDYLVDFLNRYDGEDVAFPSEQSLWDDGSEPIDITAVMETQREPRVQKTLRLTYNSRSVGPTYPLAVKVELESVFSDGYTVTSTIPAP